MKTGITIAMTITDLGKYMVFALYFLFNLLVTDGNSDVNAVYLGNTAPAIIGQEYSIDSLFIALLSNDDASIDYNLVINSNKPTTNITLFGEEPFKTILVYLYTIDIKTG